MVVDGRKKEKPLERNIFKLNLSYFYKRKNELRTVLIKLLTLYATLILWKLKILYTDFEKTLE